jgi:hypothetical protein
MPSLACVGLVIAGGGLLVVLTTLGFGGPTWRTLTWGVPAALVVAGATLGDFSPAGPYGAPLPWSEKRLMPFICFIPFPSAR